MTQSKISQAKIDAYMVVKPMLSAIYTEIKALSSKKQAEELNTKKVEIINKVLDKVLYILEDEPTLVFLEKLDQDILPTNSDAVLILSQFATALDQFHSKYYKTNEFDWGTTTESGEWNVIDED